MPSLKSDVDRQAHRQCDYYNLCTMHGEGYSAAPNTLLIILHQKIATSIESSDCTTSNVEVQPF